MSAPTPPDVTFPVRLDDTQEWLYLGPAWRIRHAEYVGTSYFSTFAAAARANIGTPVLIHVDAGPRWLHTRETP